MHIHSHLLLLSVYILHALLTNNAYLNLSVNTRWGQLLKPWESEVITSYNSLMVAVAQNCFGTEAGCRAHICVDQAAFAICTWAVAQEKYCTPIH